MPKHNGWVKIHRKILATELSPGQFKFFVGAILLAKTPQSKDSGLVELSIRKLADELYMSRSEVWRREKELEAMGMLTLLNKGFNINNYDYYQTGKTVSHTGQKVGEKYIPSVPSTGLNVSPKGLNVSPVGQSVPSHETEAAYKKEKKHKKIKNIRKKTTYFFGNILLFEEEYQKLVERFGEVGAKDKLEALSLYKWSHGKKYDSDYYTVLSWARKDEKEHPAGSNKYKGQKYGHLVCTTQADLDRLKKMREEKKRRLG